MKIMIRCDMEGVTGITRFEQTEPGQPEYPFAQKMLMNDLQAVTAGLLEAGAGDIWVHDMHYHGDNVVEEELDERVRVILGKPHYSSANAGGLDSSFNGLILVGLHSKACTAGGLLAHTYELETKDIRVNGRSLGEIGVEAAIGGDFGVPVILVTGDSKGTEEAEHYLPAVVTATVKEAISLERGNCIPARETYQILKKAAADAIGRLATCQPFVISPPIEMQVFLAAGPFTDRLRKQAGDYFVSDDQLVLKGNSVTEVWSEYQQLKTR